MASSYTVEYPSPEDFCKSGPCGSGPCQGVMYYNQRPQYFCDDVTLSKDCILLGKMVVQGSLLVETDLVIVPPEITVGEVVYKETPIMDGFGRYFKVLAAETDPFDPPPPPPT